MKKLLVAWVIWAIIVLGWLALIRGPFSILKNDLLAQGINATLWQFFVAISLLVLLVVSAVVASRHQPGE